MTPRKYFDEVWARCALFSTLHAFVASQVTAALKPDELLRAEWAARVSALDLFVHELVAQNLVSIFAGRRPTCPGFDRMHISSATMLRIKCAVTESERHTAYDLEVRTRLSRVTYQYPSDIADGVRLVSQCKLWNDVALSLGTNPANISVETDNLKRRLSAIVDRRNKIVHEGDLQPTVPRYPWAIYRTDVDDVAEFITKIVTAIEAVI